MKKLVKVAVLALSAACLFLTSCNGGGSSAKTKTITFWHLDTTDEQQAAWRQIADNFEAKHPGVKIEITCLENDSFKAKVNTVMQAGNPPDIFRSWGGGVMIDQATAGMLRPINDYVTSGNIAQIGKGAMGLYNYDGKQYGAPYSLGVVGLWYNKYVFKDCGLTPEDFSTWSKFLKSCEVLKSKGYAPIAVGEQATWTGHYWWTYIAQRLGGQPDFLAAYNGTGAFNKGSFLKAMEMLKDFVATKPFQEGYLATGHEEASAMVADRVAAMTLNGQWTPSTGRDNATKGYNDEWGVMSFPAIEGGNGLLSDTQGGGDGYIIGKNAPDEAIEFLKSFYEPENYKIICTKLNACPVVPGYDDLIDPIMVEVANAVKAAGYYQLYYDQFLPGAVGEAIKDATAGVLAGTMAPQDACDKIQKSWEENK
ncbi:MAG: extracellular solute-binding protein [Treponema sp.]|nr:extracellular solute-binding protein [Treponema sp.]